MKRIKYLVILITFFFVGMLNIKATFLTPSLYNLDIDIKINDDGSADVTETWAMQSSFLYEICKPVINLNHSQITNFKVTDEKEKLYTVSTKENEYNKYSIKAFKFCWNGSEFKSGNVEFGNYGLKMYSISYQIVNFVTKLNDSQVVDWNIVNKQSEFLTKNITITISSDKSIDKDTKIWKKGFNGAVSISDGKIIIKAEELDENDYIKIIVKLKPDMFNAAYSEKGAFNYWYIKTKFSNFFNNIDDELMIIIVGLLFVIIGTIILSILDHIPNKNNLILDIKFGKKGKKIDYNKVEYFRDIPCNGDIYRAYFIINLYNLNNSSESSLLGAVLLKWINEDKIEFVEVPSKVLGLKSKAIYLKQGEKKKFSNEYEQKLYSILLNVSKNGVLEKNELFSVPKTWYEKIITKEKAYLLRDGCLIKRKKFKLLRKYQVQPSLKKQAIELVGLKKFLLDFSVIENKSAIEIHLWEQYLIFAQLLGIADQVDDQFKGLYPNSKQSRDFLFLLYDILDF